MGGDHGHGHHGRPYEIPDYKIYHAEDVPQLAQLQKLLAQKGLKDPWIRNEVWRFHHRFGTVTSRIRKTFFTGFGVGFAAFLATIAIEKIYEKTHPSEHDHHHNHGH